METPTKFKLKCVFLSKTVNQNEEIVCHKI